jgi:hypothetical protein
LEIETTTALEVVDLHTILTWIITIFRLPRALRMVSLGDGGGSISKARYRQLASQSTDDLTTAIVPAGTYDSRAECELSLLSPLSTYQSLEAHPAR